MQIETKKETYNDEKFAELLMYVAGRMQGYSTFGAIMLNKVMFYTDFWHYAEHGVSVTGAEYQRLRRGPAPRRLLPVQRELIEDGDARLVETQAGPYRQKRLVPLREANTDVFTAEELETANKTIERLNSMTAFAVSEMSHGMSGWQIASDGQTIPYESVFLGGVEPTEDSVAFAQEVEALLSSDVRG